MAKNLKQLRITEFVCKVMKNKWLKILLIVVAAALLLSMPLGGTWWTRILINAGLMCMCVLGLNVIIGYTGMFNLGYIAMFGIGAYTYAILASPHLNIHLPFLLIFPLAGLFAGIAGALLTIPVARLRGDYLALVTLAFGEVFRLVANNLPLTNGALGIINIDTPKILSWTINSPQKHYYLVLFLVVIEAFLMSRLRRSRIGRALAAIREDEDAARAMGINSFQLKVLANFVGAIPAGLAGVLFAANQYPHQ